MEFSELIARFGKSTGTEDLNGEEWVRFEAYVVERCHIAPTIQAVAFASWQKEWVDRSRHMLLRVQYDDSIPKKVKDWRYRYSTTNRGLTDWLVEVGREWWARPARKVYVAELIKDLASIVEKKKDPRADVISEALIYLRRANIPKGEMSEKMVNDALGKHGHEPLQPGEFDAAWEQSGEDQ